MATPVGDRSSLLLGITWTWAVLSVLFVTARFYTRWKCGIRLWWDDFWILVALVCTSGMSIIFTIFVYAGGGMPFSMLSVSQQLNVFRLIYIPQPFALVALATGKLSVACLLKRVQSPCRWRTILLWILMSLLVAYNLVQIPLLFVQCDQHLFGWGIDSGDQTHCVPTFGAGVNALAGAVYNAFIDLALVVLAIQMIWNLQMSRWRKIGLGALLSTGIFPCVMATLKIADFFSAFGEADVTWSAILLFIWNACEINSVIIAACIPTLQPLFSAIFGSGTLGRHSGRAARYTARSASFTRTTGRGLESWRRVDDLELGEDNLTLAIVTREADTESSKRILEDIGSISEDRTQVRESSNASRSF